ncbi:MAG: type II toxin-antitoxin system RelE/ParE family toxin [Clostridia bacterium]|nr:type II toxin-antitoxin system RelE/ParE family toxin [Clostridia bacterium]
MKLHIHKEVSDEIHEIGNYIARDSKRYAFETMDKIYSNIYRLADSPYLGRHIVEIPYSKLREIVYKSYRIVYKVSEETDTVHILFVIHCKRDFNSFYKSYISKNKFNLYL